VMSCDVIGCHVISCDLMSVLKSVSGCFLVSNNGCLL